MIILMTMQTVAPSSVQIAWISILFPDPSGPASKTDLDGGDIFARFSLVNILGNNPGQLILDNNTGQ